MPPSWLLKQLGRTGLAGRAANAVAWLILGFSAILIVVAVAVAMQWAWTRHNEGFATNAVETYQQDVTQDAANRVIEATRKADEEAANAADQDEQNDKELKNAASQPSNATAAVLRRMRDQQTKGQR